MLNMASFKKIVRKFVINPFYLSIGFLACNSRWYRELRKGFGTPGKNYMEELKLKNRWLYLLEKSYQMYHPFKYRNIDNKEWEKLRWQDYAPIYYKCREGMTVDDRFLNFLSDSIKSFGVKKVLDLGCGGFTLTTKLARLYPENEFIGIDIADESEKIFNGISKDYPNIKFVKGSIFDHMSMLGGAIDLIYTYNVLMHFDENEIKAFFEYIKREPRKIMAIFQEPYSNDIPTKIYKQRDYCHNFPHYCRAHGLKLIGSVEKDKNFGIYYLCNK